MTNIQLTLRTAPYLCKNVSLQYCLVATVNRKQSLNSYLCVYIYIYIYPSQCGDAGRTNEIKKLEEQWMQRAKEIISRAILSTRAMGSQPWPSHYTD